ncbi:MAG: hypothetical protein LBL25_02515, partial [Oscillospiraceae bacterium]|nr:hypothetical protein [Oscillospiraceae bacterium]
LFKSLRAFGSSDFSGALERASRVERVLLQDPAGVYPEMSRGSRAMYRAEIARQAEKAGTDEEETALSALRLAEKNKAHVGEYIMPRPGSGAFYPFVIAAASLLAALLFGILSRNIWLFPLNLIAVSELIRQIADYVITRLAVSRGIPRLELRGGVPAHARTLAVIAVLLTSKESAEAAANLLERYSILNRDAGENLIFGLLADLPEAKTAETPEDAEIKAAARRAIDKLNAHAPGRFFLFLREREESRRDRVFRGRERKRGAILQLMRELTRRGAGNALTRDGRTRPSSAAMPPFPVPAGTLKFLIVLDEDTQLCAGTARELIGAMLHPLNRAVVDPKSRVVTRGHGILQPRVVTDLNASVRTEFARAFSGGGGGDAYGGSRGELYQDISGSSGFIGKGIIDVDAYLACLDGRFPAERVLSHDLLEGAYLRCGFAGDIKLSDGFPASAAPYYGRLHRWTRGDWQNAPWLLPRVRGESGERERNPLKRIDKWRIFDNLRRSLLPPCACALILAAALEPRFLPEAFAAAPALVFGHMLAAVNATLRGGLRYRRRFSFIPEAFSSRLAAAFTRLLLLPIEAAVCLSAAVTAIFRMACTKRNLLQWTTAAASEPPPQKNTPRRIPFRLSYLACLLPGLAAAVIAAATLSPSAAALAVVWCFAPVIAVSMGREKPEPAIPARNREYLLKAASGAYSYFSDFLTPQNNYLPPDNFQSGGFRDERPSAPVRYTSPTNVGLALLAPVAALELGLISKDDALKTIGAALGSVELLPKWRDHLYNWYDTEAMAPREPRFVSTVDSGNFAACLIALRESLTEYGESELAQRAERLYRAMDFSPLYDKKRRLFLIGLGGSDNKNVYDLLASETMLTSYIAVARGDAPVRHWRALSRAAARSGAYLGPASWSGSVFEYLMPMLFLPYFSGSLLRESAHFCVYAHKKAARLSCWGNSE